MEKRIVVRRLQIDDVARVATLLSDSFYANDSWLGWAVPIFRMGIYQDLKTRALTQTPRHTCLVGFQSSAQGETTLVGTVELTAKPLTAWSLLDPTVPYVSNLAVAKAFRRQGVGQHLLLACEQVANTWGFNEIYLHVQEENRSARRLYKRVGYHPYHNDVPIWARLLGSPQELLLRKPLVQSALKVQGVQNGSSA